MRISLTIIGDEVSDVLLDGDDVHADYFFEFDSARDAVIVGLDIPGISATIDSEGT